MLNHSISIRYASMVLALMGSVFGQVPTVGLTAYFPFSGDARDATGNHHGVLHGAVDAPDRFGRPRNALLFNGTGAYVEIPDFDAASIATTGAMTISVWMRPDTLDFPRTQAENYVHWMGKGEAGQHEWVLRIYDRASARPNRTSCYTFNLSGGLGAGSYVEEPIAAGEWIHIVARYNFPANQIRIYKNGVQKDEDLFTDYAITPANGTAPLRVGTRDFGSYFKGAIDDIRFYNRVLNDNEIAALTAETAGPVRIVLRNGRGPYLRDPAHLPPHNFVYGMDGRLIKLPLRLPAH